MFLDPEVESSISDLRFLCCKWQWKLEVKLSLTSCVLLEVYSCLPQISQNSRVKLDHGEVEIVRQIRLPLQKQLLYYPISCDEVGDKFHSFGHRPKRLMFIYCGLQNK